MTDFDISTIYTILTTVGTAAFIYLLYRRSEIEALATEVYHAAKDNKITEDEFQRIADRLGKVLFKKQSP